MPLKPDLAPKTYRSECVSSCGDRPNGDYQSCETCNGFVTCSNGEPYERPCPAKLVWDDVKKRCEATSTTCDILATKSQPAPVDLTLTLTSFWCVSNCRGMPDGHYQSCKTCYGYVSCSGGILYDRDCPAGLVWDDMKKRCEWYSTTCDISLTTSYPPTDEPATSSTERPSSTIDPTGTPWCVADCSRMSDGHYQSCKTCYGYVSCSGGILYDRDCPAGLVWDDVKKRCEWYSTTCDISTTSYPPTDEPATSSTERPSSTVDPTGTPWCVADCSRMPDGHYQSCKTCYGYVSCSGGILYDRDCPAGLVWDDVKKRCEWYSTTCDISTTSYPPTDEPATSSTERPSSTVDPTGTPWCVADCSRMPDGHYQSCKTCNGYVSCSGGILYDRDCPAGLVWDDVKKRCEWYSTTCDIRSTTSYPPTDEPATSSTERPSSTVDPTGTPWCVADCSHMPDGHYQSCKTCYGYVSCSGGILYDRDCPAGLVWDDVKKRCEWYSTTCDIRSTTSYPPTDEPATSSTERPSSTVDPTGTPWCVADCSRMPDGHYQSCKTCNGYVSCSGGILYDRDCPAGLVWDDVKKRCEWYSTTCDIRSTTSYPPTDEPATSSTERPSSTVDPTGTPWCVADCSRMPDGHYQSCKTCYGYVSCSGGIIYDRPCPADLVWDDMKKRCEWYSTTCDMLL